MWAVTIITFPTNRISEVPFQVMANTGSHTLDIEMSHLEAWVVPFWGKTKIQPNFETHTNAHRARFLDILSYFDKKKK